MKGVKKNLHCLYAGLNQMVLGEPLELLVSISESYFLHGDDVSDSGCQGLYMLYPFNWFQVLKSLPGLTIEKF